MGCRRGVCGCSQALWSHAVKRSQSGFVGFHADYTGIFQQLIDIFRVEITQCMGGFMDGLHQGKIRPFL